MANSEGGAGAEAAMAAFTVAKGGVVLKHIFLNAPPTDEEARRCGDVDVEEEEEDPPVLFGRHPDCHVLVDHPSVSRRHLEIRCKRRQRRITVTDLSSVHGTWVSGQRIPPNTPVELAAGDTLQLGGSRREYRLLWLSLREAFEMEDLLPPLVEEDKEELRTHQEAMQQVVSEQMDSRAEAIPSAPPLPEFTHSFSPEKSSFSQFDVNTVGVIEENMVNSNTVIESVGSSTTQTIPATVSSARKPVESDKQGASSTISRRSKLKSVKSLHIDTGRSKQTSSALSYSFQKEAQNENLECHQNCGKECAACMVLFDNSDVKEAEEKEKMIAPDKDYMNHHVLDSITKEGYQDVTNPLNLKHSDKENSMLNFGKEKEQHGFFSENSTPQDSVDVELQKIPHLLYSVSTLVLKDGTFADEIPQLDATVHMESYEPVSANPFMQDIVCENMSSHEDMKYDGLSHLSMDGNLSGKENMTRNKIVVGPEDYEFEGTIYGSLFENVDIKTSEENEESSLLDKENSTPDVAGNITTERSQLTLKPISSQELMDSISPLNLEYDDLSDYDNSKDITEKQMKSIRPISENLSPLISVDAILQKSQTVSMPMSHPDFENENFPDKDNSVMAPGKYDAAISPVKQGDLFQYKKNVTPPASKDLKSISRKVLGSRMDSSVSVEYTPNRSMNKQECNELSSKSKRFHTVDDEAFYSDKENLTPISSAGVKARRCLPKILFTEDADQDQGVFYSDKENSTPVSSAPRKIRDMSENRERMESAITKKRVVDRLPFQTLLSNSPLRPTSSFDCTQAAARAANVAIRLGDELSSLQHKNQESDRVGDGMKVWTMVIDTDCLLDDESRKSIMLLKGIKGTHLIIPRIVIRELDCMKQREGLLRRSSSKATTILQWIEECMENESWWIHVQSSSEMSPVAPTPPATPTTQYDNAEGRVAGAGAFSPMFSLFSPRSFPNIVSPRTEDRVLECALLFGKQSSSSSSQTMVILSNSVTLKIKAMAEGLLCEGAKEFRETLMNPCSGRFMWAASAPRGSAWSCLDEAALAENYYNSHHHHHGARRKVPRPVESARGLKLILLHNNSLYAQATSSVASRTPLASLASW